MPLFLQHSGIHPDPVRLGLVLHLLVDERPEIVEVLLTPQTFGSHLEKEAKFLWLDVGFVTKSLLVQEGLDNLKKSLSDMVNMPSRSGRTSRAVALWSLRVILNSASSFLVMSERTAARSVPLGAAAYSSANVRRKSLWAG